MVSRTVTRLSFVILRFGGSAQVLEYLTPLSRVEGPQDLPSGGAGLGRPERNGGGRCLIRRPKLPHQVVVLKGPQKRAHVSTHLLDEPDRLLSPLR